MQFLHVIITHVPPEKVHKHLALTEAITPGPRRLIAYGGPRESFDRLEAPDKFFLEDPSLRGPVISQCFNELFPKIWQFTLSSGAAFDFVHVSEYDHLILSRDYFDQLTRVIKRSGAEFIGRGCGLKTHSNWQHRFRDGMNPALLDYLRLHSVRQDKTEICGTLGNGFTLSRKALQAMAELPNPPRVYNEVFFPTMAHHLGFTICDIGSYSTMFRHVRWGPVWTSAEIKALMRQGAACAHPFKDIDTAEPIVLGAAKEVE